MTTPPLDSKELKLRAVGHIRPSVENPDLGGSPETAPDSAKQRMEETQQPTETLCSPNLHPVHVPDPSPTQESQAAD